MFPWNKEVYRKPSPIWNFLPPEHRPEGKDPNHSDWPGPFKSIPRTWTSFDLSDAKVISGGTKESFLWKCTFYPKPWQVQKTLIVFKNPLTGERMSGVYEVKEVRGRLIRTGPRISDDLENGPGYVYVNYVPLLGNLLTIGTKELKIV